MIHNHSGRVISAASARKCEQAHAELWADKKAGKDTKVIRFRVDTFISGKPAGKLMVEVDLHGMVRPVGLADL